MKRIMKKNQIIITSMAILIAIAGYLNYTERDNEKITVSKKVESVNDTVDETIDELNEESNDEINSDSETDIDVFDEQEDVEPGEAIFTNAGTFSANAKLSREQIRAQNKESLMNMLNSGSLSEEQKNNITNQMIKITEKAELENEIETLIEAKGYEDVVVSVDDDKVDVVINMTEVDDAQRAAIEDVIKRKTNISAKNIVITPINQE